MSPRRSLSRRRKIRTGERDDQGRRRRGARVPKEIEYLVAGEENHSPRARGCESDLDVLSHIPRAAAQTLF